MTSRSVALLRADESRRRPADERGLALVLPTFLPCGGRLVSQWPADHTHGLSGPAAILPLDMYEHAYHIDCGAAAAKYGDAFMDNVRRENVSRLHQKHAR